MSSESFKSGCNNIIIKGDLEINKQFLTVGYTPEKFPYPPKPFDQTAIEEFKKMIGQDILNKRTLHSRLDKKDQLISTDKTIQSEYGNVTITISYNAGIPDSVSIYIKGDYRSDRSVDVYFDHVSGVPMDFSVRNDPDDFFATLFSVSGYAKLGKMFSLANAQGKLTELRQEISFQQCVAEGMEGLKKAPVKQITNIYHGQPGKYIQVDQYLDAPIETPLATMGLNMCSALIIIDVEGKRHFLAHIYPTTPIQSIEESLRNFGNLNGKKVYIMKGSVTDSVTSLKILSVLGKRIDSSKVQLISPFKKGKKQINLPAVVIANGDVFIPHAQQNLYEDARWDKKTARKFNSPYHASKEYFDRILNKSKKDR